ncbi:hypothetical protein HDG40_001582 [Paraburkholderia sp. JPY158]|uniref:UDP-glucose 4-epimerase n=2 Tax=Paraburkholderia atlantica TaxID=2654982 RepID=A0A7W8Q506_PARAM|nr:hypothetical protein [Paraburkholderia atlantica]
MTWINETGVARPYADGGNRSRQPEEHPMAISANAQQGTWSVSVHTEETQEGGFRATIHVKHVSPEGDFERTFQQSQVFAVEREAVLEGLREGMTWIALKTTRTIGV